MQPQLTPSPRSFLKKAALYILDVQKRWAVYLQVQAAKLSFKQLVVLLLLFALVCSGFCGYLVLSSLSRGRGSIGDITPLPTLPILKRSKEKRVISPMLKDSTGRVGKRIQRVLG